MYVTMQITNKLAIIFIVITFSNKYISLKYPKNCETIAMYSDNCIVIFLNFFETSIGSLNFNMHLILLHYFIFVFYLFYLFLY